MSLGEWSDQDVERRLRRDAWQRHDPVGPGRWEPVQSGRQPFGERLQMVVELAASGHRMTAQTAREDLVSLVGGSAAGALEKAVAGSLSRGGAVASCLAGRAWQSSGSPVGRLEVTGDFDPPGDGTLHGRADAIAADHQRSGSYVGQLNGMPARTPFDSQRGWVARAPAGSGPGSAGDPADAGGQRAWLQAEQ